MKIYMSTLAVIFLLALSPNSEGHIFGENGLIADNKTHYVCWNDTGSYPPELSGVLYFFNNYYYIPTTGMHAVSYPCVPLVDVFFDDNLYQPDTLGRWTCTVPDLANGICIQGTAKINLDYTSYSATYHGHVLSDLRWKVWKHELGHSFGLNHEPYGSAMMQGGQYLFYFYSADHIGHMESEISFY